jgi:hypothetical protein
VQRAIRRFYPAVIVLATGFFGVAEYPQVWQADIQIRTLEVTRNRSSINARVVVYTENDDEAQNARLLIILPIGVGIERLATGCNATPGPSMVPTLRAAVVCDLGAIPNRGLREISLMTTAPRNAATTRFGVFTYSSTPDPVPGNNYAERTIP